jgi:hypothetical protein
MLAVFTCQLADLAVEVLFYVSQSSTEYTEDTEFCEILWGAVLFRYAV